MNIPSNILTMLAGIFLTLVSIWYGQNHGLMPIEASDDAAKVDGLFNTMMTIGTGLFLLVVGVILICLVRFRRRPGDETDGPPIEGNIPLEILWTAIPVVIVLVIGVYSFDVYNALGGFDPEAAEDPGLVQVAMLPDAADDAALLAAASPKPHHHHHVALGVGADPDTVNHPPDLTVNVLGLQYAWLFTYPDLGVTTGELHVPVGKDLRLLLKAQDVIHAFWLPEFRLKQDTLPNQQAELRFVPKRIGEYPIVCAELCGPYHGGMASKLYVHSQEDYDQWVQSQIAAKTPDSEKTVAMVGDRSDSDAAYLARHADHLANHLGIDTTTLSPLPTSNAVNHDSN